MGGIFGTISKKSCVADLFYGTDYNSHLGTRRGGMATYSKEKGFTRSIHNLESSYFRTKFESTLDKFEGSTSGIGVISDTDAQPLIMNSHLGRSISPASTDQSRIKRSRQHICVLQTY